VRIDESKEAEVDHLVLEMFGFNTEMINRLHNLRIGQAQGMLSKGLKNLNHKGGIFNDAIGINSHLQDAMDLPLGSSYI
jgi:hypothetical protein